MTPFTIRVYEYTGTGDNEHDYRPSTDDNGQEIAPDFTAEGWTLNNTYTANSTLAAIVSSYTLSGLTELSVRGGYSYGLEVSAEFDGTTYTAYALVSVSAKPAVVDLDQPTLYYTESTAAGGVTLTWTVRNFDVGNGGQFELVITNNETGIQKTTSTSALTEESSGLYTGSYRLDFDDMQSGNMRETYTVELRAKNSDNSTWSYDSAVLYLYADEAFQIYINGQAAGGSHTMSNEDYPVDGATKSIAEMDRDEILALNRAISLADTISINPNVPWGNVSDQIVWTNTDPDTATINYRQGVLYEDIRLFDYESYNPTTAFILSGLQDGQTTITAAHKTAGDVLNDQVNVTVETLEDKLYLFQVAPAATTDGVTVLEYTNGAGEAKSIIANEKGLAAVYEETGIASDVYCRTVVDGTTYVGTFYQENLLSGETDSTRLLLYPQNTLRLREVATARLYLKDENGNPYANKQLTIHAGVYKNGVYCPEAAFTTNSDGSNMVSGAGEGFTATTGSDGKLTIYMDVDQFYTGAETTTEDRALQATDRLTFMFEVEMTGDGVTYYPQLLQLDGMASQSDTVRFGQSIVSLRRNDSTEAHPYVVLQTATSSAVGSSNLIGFTGNVGPGPQNPELDLETTVLWWGETAAEDWDIAYYDSVGARVPNQTTTNQTYEFTDTMVTCSTVHLDAAAMDSWLPSLTSRSLELRYYDGSDGVVRIEPQTFRVVNMVHAATPDQDEAAKENINELMSALLASMGRSGGDIGIGDSLLGAGFALVGNTGMDFTVLKLSLYGTEDPTVFRGLFSFNYGNAESAVELKEGINTEKLDIAKNLVSGDARRQTKDSVMSALETMKNGGTGLVGGFGLSGKEFGGYIESEIYFEDGQWHIYVLNGGFNAGAGLEYMWRINSWVGPVPVTAEFALGGTVAVSLDVGVDRLNDLNYYLTNLRIGAYFRAFGGLGFDYSIIALKIGLFGNLDLYYNARFFNVSDEAASPYNNMIGHSLDAGGQVGIEFYAKFIFISYRTILASAEFTLADEEYGQWDAINSAWEQVGKGVSGTGGVLTSSQIYYDARTGQTLYASPTVAAMESRDYLSEGSRRWNPLRISLFGLDATAAVDTTLTNAYPDMDPLVTEDGQIMVYLDDDPDNKGADVPVTDTRAAFSVWSGNQFGAGSSIDDRGIGEGTGYGDSQLAVSGTKSFAVAAWTRLTTDPGVAAGATMTAAQQAEMMNSTDVMAAVYDGTIWTTTLLSDSSATAPDLAPAVAAANGKAIVAWRSVASTNLEESLTRFDAEDSILYRTYENGQWSEVKTLYNGTSGAVKGLEAAIMDEGTAALVYTIDTHDRPIAADGVQTYTQSGQSAQDNTGLEVVYAIVDDLTGRGNETDDLTAVNVRLTYDDQLDENPQITTAEIGGEAHFIIAWSRTEQSDGDGSTSGQDVALRAVKQDGQLRSDLPDSVAEMARGDGVGITSNFRFSKGADTLSDLSIVWVEPVSGGDPVGDDGTITTDKDRLMAVKFVENSDQSGGTDSYGITVPVEMAIMPDYTTINHFDAYLQTEDIPDLRAVILGTTYGGSLGYTNYVVGADGTLQEVTEATENSVAVANSESTLYTAAGEYTNQVSIDQAEYEASSVIPGLTLPVQLTVTNRGIEPITELQVQIGEQALPPIEDVSLAPGQNLTLTVDYIVPSAVTDVECTVTATFDTEEEPPTKIATTELALATPDVGISRMELVKQEDGQRVIQVALYNDGEVPLDSSKHTVKVALYSDAACENQIAGPVTVTDLNMVNDGGYTTQLTFDIGEYVRTNLGETSEIPDGGIQVYAKAWIETTQSLGTRIVNFLSGDNQEPEVVQDTRVGNDIKTLKLTSLLEQNNNEPATVTSVVDNSGEVTKLAVTVQNNSLTTTTTGNLIVTLLDASGNVLAQLQSYDSTADDDGLITLSPEYRLENVAFTFSRKGDQVKVTYSNAILTDDNNANLAAVQLEGVELTYNDATSTYTGSTTSISQALLTLVPEDPRASITVNGAAYTQATNINLSNGTNTFTITVTAATGGGQKTYTLVLDSSGISTGGGGGSGSTTYLVETPTQTEHGTVSVRPSRAERGDTVTITAVPDEGYQVGSVTVIQAGGGSVAVSAGENGTYTFTMPGSRVTVEVAFVPEGTQVSPFVDVPASAYYYDAVQWAVANGITQGTTATTFSPNNPCTRAQVVTFLWRVNGSPTPQTNENPFTDVSEGAYYADAVLWAVEQGITTGTTATTFSPDNPCTRAQVAAFLWRSEDTPEVAGASGFTDVAEDAYYADAVAWAVANGVTQGTTATTFSPNNPCTRAQIVTFLYRAMA